jgi:acetyl-CoA carboxylase biotin carboxyl carrier protein
LIYLNQFSGKRFMLASASCCGNVKTAPGTPRPDRQIARQALVARAAGRLDGIGCEISAGATAPALHAVAIKYEAGETTAPGALRGSCLVGKARVNHIERGVTMADVLAPLAGKIWQVLVEVGAKVEEDDELIVIEALKMENTVYSPSAGTVKEIKVKKGDSVEDEQLLIVLE